MHTTHADVEESERGPAFALLELCSIAQGVVTHDIILKKAVVDVQWARVYNPGKYAVMMRGGEGEVLESFKAARECAGPFEVDSVYLPNPHPELIRSLSTDARPPSALFQTPTQDKSAESNLLEAPAVAVIECYSLCATIRAAERILKGSKVHALALRLDPTLGGKGCFLCAGNLEDIDEALALGKEAAGRAFFYHAQRIPRPHMELPLALSTSYPPPQSI